MGIRSTWICIEAVLNKRGFELADVDQVPQGRRCTMRIVEIPGDQIQRGAIGGGKIRLVWGLEIALIYEIGNDKRLERKVAEDAEDVIAAIYGDETITNAHRYVGASIERNVAQGVVVNTMRFDVQDQAAL